MFLRHTTEALKNPHLLTNCFGPKTAARITAELFCVYARSQAAPLQEEAKSSDFLPKGQLLQTDQTESSYSCQLPLLLLQRVRNSIWFPVKLQRKTKQMWDPQPMQCQVSHLTKLKAISSHEAALYKQQWNCEELPDSLWTWVWGKRPP